jgi:lipid-binding SYLF domain-containing protein
LCSGGQALASDDSVTEAIHVFQQAGQSGKFFGSAYGYVVFPTIGKGGFVVGAAYGEGRVFAQGASIGTATMTQLSVGFQLGGQAYSEIIFFQDKRALDDFTSGNFEFGADASVVAITASASAQANTTGSSAGISGGRHDAATAAPAGYYHGMATFTVAHGGLMYEATLSGQKFKFNPGAP